MQRKVLSYLGAWVALTSCAPAALSAGSTLPTPVHTGTDQAPAGIATGDVNKDALTDLITSTYGGEARALISDGVGAFASRWSGSVGSFPYWVAVADLNHDHRDDAAIVDSSTSGGVKVFLGTSTASFDQPRTIETGSFTNSVVVADFNADGDPDLAVANYVAVSAYLGDGQGGFTPAPHGPIASADRPHHLSLGDFDRDGWQDIAFTAALGATSASVYFGKGDGSFTASRPLNASQPFAIAAGDVDGDLDQDLFLLNGGFQNSLSVFLSDGARGFSALPDVPLLGGGNPYQAAVGDLDGDGSLDVAVSIANAGFGKVDVLTGDGHGAFTHRWSADYPVAASTTPGQLTVGDFDGDRRCDLAVALIAPGTAGGVDIYRGADLGGSVSPLPEACRDRVHDPAGDARVQVASRRVVARPGAVLSLSFKVGQTSVVRGTVLQSTGKQVSSTRTKVTARGGHALRIRAPRRTGTYRVRVRVGTLDGSVAVRVVRLIVRPAPRR